MSDIAYPLRQSAFQSGESRRFLANPANVLLIAAYRVWRRYLDTPRSFALTIILCDYAEAEQSMLHIGGDSAIKLVLALMQRVRAAFDPDGLCNPGKVFPTPRLCGEVPGPYRRHPVEAAGLAERM
jgi:hypothetical protein